MTNDTKKDAEKSACVTDVYVGFAGCRKPHSVRCNDKLFTAWKREILARKDSICNHQELWMAVDLVLMRPDVYLSNTLGKDGFCVSKNLGVGDVHVTIEGGLHVQRVVKREKRLYPEFEADPNFFDARLGWIHKSDEVLNGNGHAVGCGCKICSRGRR